MTANTLGKRERELVGMSAATYVKLALPTSANLEKLGVPQMACDTARQEAEAIVALLSGAPDLFNRFTPSLRARAIRCVRLVQMVAEQKKKGVEALLFDTTGIQEGEHELERIVDKLERGASL